MAENKLDKEVKVGALVFLVSLVLMAGLMMLGELDLGGEFNIFTRFDNAGGLEPGAEVRVAGIPVGRVAQVMLRQEGRGDTAEGIPALVRLAIVTENRDMIGEGAVPVITTQGVLSAPYIEVLNAEPLGAPVGNGIILEGESRPRMDQMYRRLYEGLGRLETASVELVRFVDDNDVYRRVTGAADWLEEYGRSVADNRDSVTEVVTSVGSYLDDNGESMAGGFGDLERGIQELETILRELNRDLDDGEELHRLLNEVEETTGDLAANSPEIFQGVADFLSSARDEIGADHDRLSDSLAVVNETMAELLVTSEEVARATAEINDGQGVVGSFIRDEELFEDVREWLDELSVRPWRLIWRE